MNSERGHSQKDLVVRVLPQILKAKASDAGILMKFLDIDFDTDKPNCNLETVIRDKNVPLYSEV